MINGKAEHRPEGVYALKYLRCGVRVFESIGNDSQLALTAKLRVEHLLMGASLGLTEQAVKPMSSIGRTNLDESISEYLADTKQLKARSTHLAYSLTLLGFRAACPGAKYLEAITRRDILTYMDDLRKSGSAPRTIANRVDFLKIFFNRLKVAWPMEKTDKVKYTEKEVSAHNREEIEKLLGVADQDETHLLLFLLQTGAREKEVQFACWSDVDFVARTFTVREKLNLQFIPKDKEEGSIPIPNSLVGLCGLGASGIRRGQ